jgi:hypothetical protein
MPIVSVLQLHTRWLSISVLTDFTGFYRFTGKKFFEEPLKITDLQLRSQNHWVHTAALFCPNSDLEAPSGIS